MSKRANHRILVSKQAKHRILTSKQANHRILFAKWINKVIKRVLKAYPSLKIMAWDDMYRNWHVSDMMLLKQKN